LVRAHGSAWLRALHAYTLGMHARILLGASIALGAIAALGAAWYAATLGAAKPASQVAAAEVAAATSSYTAHVPILVYHIVRPADPSDSAAVRAIRVTPEVFDQELSWLAENGYHVIPLSALEAYLASGTPLAAKPVVINFDDAWEDQYQYAFPILKKYGDTATFFVPSNFPGNKSFLTWSELREMIAAGMSIGSHSRSHPYLTRITSTTTLADEIAGSRSALEEKLGVPITEFDYPFGLYNAEDVAMVEAAGYKAARTDSFGLSGSTEDLFTLPALTAPTTLAAFKQFFPHVP
jgi:peptidoglycan/xylan/chitin deacetylase (PgdA/CDA1 family)